MSICYCIECGGPWGSLDTSDEARSDLLAAAQEAWGLDVADDIEEGVAVFITGAQASFAADRFGAEILVDDVWQNAEHVDAPGWWLSSRKCRPALMLECCRNWDRSRRMQDAG